MQTENNWISRLQETLMQTVEQCFNINWGRDIQNNWGFVLDLKAIADAQSSDELRLLDQAVNTNGIEIHATVGDTISSLAEITQAVYHLLGREAEDFLVVVLMPSKEALRYWFMTGSSTHGHIGEIVISRENIKHIDLPVLDTTP